MIEAPRRTGVAELPLHAGKTPRWLFERMVRLAREIMCHIVAEYGEEEALRRLSDPFWFQAFGCALGFDWHSSGVTTTTCGAVKMALRGLESDLGLYAAGGKGATSRRTPAEITVASEILGRDPAPLIYASRIAAKVDNAAVQDMHQLYHHAFFFTKGGSWCIVQQGMSPVTRTARRYHWLGEKITSFVVEPHAAVCCDVRGVRLNLVAEESGEARVRAAEIAARPPKETLSLIERAPKLVLPRRELLTLADIDPRYLHKILLKTYERAPKDFETLLGIEGVGPKTLRALALVSELIFGAKASTRDPARFAFAHGGKDRTPYPVDRATYDKTIDVLHDALDHARVDRSEKVKALKRLAGFAERPAEPPAA